MVWSVYGRCPLSELISTISRLVSMMAAFAGVAAVAYFVLGAYKYIAASGSSQKLDEAKESMKQAIIGLVAILVAFGLINTIIAQIGDTGAALSIGQLTGTDSGDLEGPYLVAVKEGPGMQVAPTRWTEVQVRFSENVVVQAKEKIFLLTREHGVFPVDRVTNSEIIFDVGRLNVIWTAAPNLCRNSGDIAEYVVEGIMLGGGASIEDEDGNPARYVFSPALVKYCER